MPLRAVGEVFLEPVGKPSSLRSAAGQSRPLQRFGGAPSTQLQQRRGLAVQRHLSQQLSRDLIATKRHHRTLA